MEYDVMACRRPDVMNIVAEHPPMDDCGPTEICRAYVENRAQPLHQKPGIETVTGASSPLPESQGKAQSNLDIRYDLGSLQWVSGFTGHRGRIRWAEAFWGQTPCRSSRCTGYEVYRGLTVVA